MIKLYVTFGQVHTHLVNGKTLNKDSVAVINCEGIEEGRKLAFEFFGDKFFTTYTEKQVNKEMMSYFPRGFIEVNPVVQSINEGKPEITQCGLLCMQACVPSTYTDEQVIAFVEGEHPCGTTHGWGIRKQGSKYLNGSDERVKCAEREGYVHIMLDA